MSSSIELLRPLIVKLEQTLNATQNPGINMSSPQTTALTENTNQLVSACVAGAYLQCVNKHFVKFEYKGMKTVKVTDYTLLSQCKHSKVV